MNIRSKLVRHGLTLTMAIMRVRPCLTMSTSRERQSEHAPYHKFGELRKRERESKRDTEWQYNFILYMYLIHRVYLLNITVCYIIDSVCNTLVVWWILFRYLTCIVHTIMVGWFSFDNIVWFTVLHLYISIICYSKLWPGVCVVTYKLSFLSPSLL